MMNAQKIMTWNVVTVKEDLLVKDLAKILSENRISGVPVVDDAGKVIGIVTENDLIDQTKKIHIPTVVSIFDSFLFLESTEKLEKDLKKMAASTVKDICSREIVSVNIDAPLDEIATLMSEKKVHTLPVMDGGKLVGVIGKSDIIRTLALNGNQ